MQNFELLLPHEFVFRLQLVEESLLTLRCVD